MDIEKIGKFIKELRNEKNISQNELSEEMHVTRQAISNWENGKAIPDSDILLLLSTYFNVSINEILSGSRNTDDESLQDIALQLIDENNSKKRKIKRILFTSTILITSLLVFFLGYYFMNNYNSIKVYSVKGQSENYKTYNGIFVATRNKIYLRLGRIKQYGKKEIDKINKIQLFYLNNKKEKIIIIEDDNTDLLLDEDFGYKEYFYNTNLNNVLKNMYIEITYNEKEKEIIKLDFNEKFKNNYLFKTIEKQKVLKDEITPESIIKKDKQLEELLSYEKLKVEELMSKRKNLDIKNNDEVIYKEIPKEKIVYINNNEDEPEKEDMIEQIEEDNISQEVKTTEEKETPISNDEEKPNEIETIKNQIIEKGTFEFGTYKLEIIIDNKLYILYCDGQNIVIEIIFENTIEEIQLFTEFNGYSWQIYENYEEIQSKNGKIDNEEVIKKLLILIENNI